MSVGGDVGTQAVYRHKVLRLAVRLKGKHGGVSNSQLAYVERTHIAGYIGVERYRGVGHAAQQGRRQGTQQWRKIALYHIAFEVYLHFAGILLGKGREVHVHTCRKHRLGCTHTQVGQGDVCSVKFHSAA